MSVTSLPKRIGRLAIAPIRGFFITSWKVLRSREPRPPAPSFWAHTQQVLHQDFIDSLVPFTCAAQELRSELHRKN
jgi:hypothetical protein